MEGIRYIGMSVCITAVAASIFSMLLPGKKLDRVLKFSVSLFFLAGVAAPFFEKGLDFSFALEWSGVTSQSEPQLSEAVSSEFSALAQRKLAAAVEQALLEKGIAPEKVAVMIHIDEEGGVSISRAELLLPVEEKQQSAEVEATVREVLGIEPVLLWTGEQEEKP